MSKKRIFTIEDFVKKAKQVHGNKYDYSDTEYVNAKTKVSVICKKHGPFLQLPGDHVYQKNGCPTCAISQRQKSRRYTFDDFVNKAREIHGNHYKYHRDTFISFSQKTKITCPKHGDFFQLPNNHVNSKRQCRKCSIENKRFGSKYNKFQFIERAKNVHGNKYDYSNVIYKNTKTKVSIVCPKHGTFSITPNAHIDSGKGCIKCGYEQTSQKKLKYSLKEFIDEANQIHDNKYDYSLIKKYRGIKQTEKIICPEHGIFEQKLEYHLGGHGCAKCSYKIGGYNESFFSFNPQYKDTKGFIYLITLTDNDKKFLKIGISKRGIKHRLWEYKKHYTIHETLAWYCDSLYKCFTVEQSLLETFEKHQYKSNYHFCGHTECFDDIVYDDLVRILDLEFTKLNEVNI